MPIDCALIVGHRRSAQGAVSADGKTTEWRFWKDAAQVLAGLLGERGLSVTVVEREDSPEGYRRLPGRVLALEPRCAVSLHLNAASAKATGTETLTAAGDAEDERLGQLIQSEMVRALGLRDRGLKPIPEGHRGATLLFGLWTVPCCLIEPCFISNPDDEHVLHSHRLQLLDGIASGIADYLSA